MRKHLHIHFLIYSATAAVFIFLAFKYPFSLGGSLSLCLLMLTFIPIVQRIGEVANALDRFCFVLAGIIALNFLFHWESAYGLNVAFIVILEILVLWLIMWFLAAAESIMKPQDQLSEKELQSLRNVRKTLAIPLFFVGLLFSGFSSLTVLDILESDPMLYNNIPLLRASHISLGFVVISFIISMSFLNRMRDSDLKDITKRLEGLKISNERTVIKWYWSIIGPLIILGSGLELERGMWAMWIETVLLICLMALMLWKLFKVCIVKAEASSLLSM